MLESETTEVVGSDVNLFSRQAAMLSIQSCYSETVPTKSQLDPGTTLQFTVDPSKDYTDLSDCWLFVRCALFKADGTSIGNAPTVGPINDIGNGMWKSVDCYLNGEKVTPSDDNYAFVSFLHNMLASEETKQTMLRMALFIEDNPLTNTQAMKQANPAGTIASALLFLI